MKTGDTVHARIKGSRTARVAAVVELISENGQACVVSAPEGLGGMGRGFAVDSRTGRMFLCLLHVEGVFWRDVNTDLLWSLEPDQGDST